MAEFVQNQSVFGCCGHKPCTCPTRNIVDDNDDDFQLPIINWNRSAEEAKGPGGGGYTGMPFGDDEEMDRVVKENIRRVNTPSSGDAIVLHSHALTEDD